MEEWILRPRSDLQCNYSWQKNVIAFSFNHKHPQCVYRYGSRFLRKSICSVLGLNFAATEGCDNNFQWDNMDSERDGTNQPYLDSTVRETASSGVCRGDWPEGGAQLASVQEAPCVHMIRGRQPEVQWHHGTGGRVPRLRRGVVIAPKEARGQWTRQNWNLRFERH